MADNYLHITQEDSEYYVPLAAFFDSKKQDKFAEYSISNEEGTLNYLAKTKGLYIGPYSSAHIYLKNDLLSLAGDEVLISSDGGHDYYTSTIDFSKEDGLRLVGKRPQSDIALQPNSSITLNGKTARFELFGAQSSPLNVIGIATPLSEASTYKGIVEADLPYQAVNKEYVDTNFQAKLISGTNIKTINNQSLLGSGNIDISGGGGTITVDAELSETSTNPVQNKIITEALNNKQDKITNKTDLRLNSVLLGNANVILRGDYNPTTGGTGYMLKIGGDITSDKVRITNIDDGIAADNAVNKKQLDAKQDKFATVANIDSTQTVTIADTLTITTNPNLLADQIISTKALFLQGSSTSGVRLGKTVLEGSSDFDATAGYLRVRDNPLADDFAVNKKYVDNSVNTKLSATTNKYSISWDDTNEGLKITFKE